MDQNKINITHSFYLKKFQLLKPKLGYEYILFDEAQDASDVMLDIVNRQTAIKVFVGDAHQQIYGWRYAINSLEKVNFKECSLSTSFRFSQSIADRAMKVLKTKNMLKEYLNNKSDYQPNDFWEKLENKTDSPVRIIGVGKSKEEKIKAVLFRTNLSLLYHVVEIVIEKEKFKKIYFEGKIDSYTYAEEGTSLYDILHFYMGRKRRVKNKVIKNMQDIGELKEYIDATESTEMAILLKIVKKYEDKIKDIIEEIKSKHVKNKEEAEIIFSTVHKSKGMEYDVVKVPEDEFMHPDKIKRIIAEDIFNPNKNFTDNNLSNIEEEINLCYVAVTRTKNILKRL